jgi:hypothetical protein
MASKKDKKQEQETPAAPVDAMSPEEQDSSYRSWQHVKPDLIAAIPLSAREHWRSPILYGSRQIELLGAEILLDRAAIFARLSPGEQADLAPSFERLAPLARSVRFVLVEAEGQQVDRKVLSAAEYRSSYAQLMEDRRVLFMQAPSLVSMGAMTQARLDVLRGGVGPLNFASDVEALVAVASGVIGKLVTVQEILYERPEDRLSPERLSSALANASRLVAHVGRSLSERPDTANVDWSAHLKANLYLLRTVWACVCDAARFHYGRAKQPDKIKRLIKPLGALRERA